jgi:hypothetical protein
MNRIVERFTHLREKQQKGFVVYIGAGDPSLEATRQLALAFDQNGVDILELGVPFSDPLADGLVNQLAAQRGLPLVDPSDAFLESYRATGEPLHGFSNAQPGEGHVNARGHALMANELVTVLRREGLVRRTSR